MTINVQSYLAGVWTDPSATARNIQSAVTGELVARAGHSELDSAALLAWARDSGGPALREMTFHARARALKQMAQYLNERKEELYQLAFSTGATKADSMIDVDGGIGTLFSYSSAGRRELPDEVILPDGEIERLSRNGSFLGQHVYTSRPGVAVHINAFNFPVWGMLEKIAPTLLAGMPAIIKPATATCYVTEACFRLMLASDAFPPGSMQLTTSVPGELLDSLGCQDAVSFTGSADTAMMLRTRPALLSNGVPFIAEQDSLNASMIGADVTRDSPEFDLFVKEVCREMTVKAGQKCTAIRRIIVPQSSLGDIAEAITARLAGTRIGDPSDEATRMGALVSQQQRDDVLEKAALIGAEARMITGAEQPQVHGADPEKGAYVQPMLFQCDDPDASTVVHEVEAFGPVATLMAYRDVNHAQQLLNRGGGSLVASVVTGDAALAREIVLASGAWHGRLYFNNSVSMAEATGHGSPMPQMVHGGPGRAGGGEELGGVRAVKHYMQRTAIQGSPDIIAAITNTHIPGASITTDNVHPFRKTFDEVNVGDTLKTAARTISLDDIEHFAHFTGDTFYAHMDDAAASANPFFPGRVAHGYLLLSFAAGLFVDPDPGPVLANTGLNKLAFQKPVSPGDSIAVTLTVKRKTRRNEQYGEVAWAVLLHNQDDEQVASYELLTMNAS